MGVLIFKNTNLFPQTSANHTPIKPFTILSKVESTNNYAMAKLHGGLVGEGACFQAIEQTAGRGQRGKQWISNPGENVTMTTVFAPGHSIASKVSPFPFLLSAAMALGCYDFIKDCTNHQLFIKWPNDLYLNDRKAAGILIENIYKGSSWEWCVVGIGLNANQPSFPAGINAVSLNQLTGTHYDIVQIGKKLHQCLLTRYTWLSGSTAGEVMKEYNSHLYKKNEEVKLRSGAVVFSAMLEEVSPNGELITKSSVERMFKVGEVEFV